MPYSAPTEGDLHVNRPLTNFSQKYLLNNSMFISTRAMPNLPVGSKSDQYWEFNRGDFMRDEAKLRADGTESQGSGWRLSRDTYFTDVWAFHKDISDRQRDNQDMGINLEEASTQFVTQKLLIRRELSFLDAYFGTGKWTTDNTTEQNWGGTGDPIAAVRTGKRVVQGLTGYRPNKMMIARESYDLLLDNDAVLARIIGGATRDVPAEVMRALIAQLFELDEIFVVDLVYNSAPADASNPDAGKFQFAAENGALLYYAPNSVGLNEPTAGTQFSWAGFRGAVSNGQRIKRFRMENIESDRIEGQMAFDYKLVGPDLGYFFSAVNGTN